MNPDIQTGTQSQDNLTPQLNEQQLKENIDALQKGGMSNDKVQAYADNYQKGNDGNYTLKNSQTNSQPGLLGGIASDIQQRGENLRPAIEQAGGNFANVPELALNIAGQGMGAVNDIANRLTPNSIKQPIGNAINWALQPSQPTINKLTPKTQDFANKNPRFVRAAESVGNIAQAAPLIAGGEAIANATPDIAKASLNVGKEALGATKQAVGDYTSGLKETIKPNLTPEEATTQIVGGKTKDIPLAKRTFSNLADTSNIKTNVDLSKAIDNQIIKPGVKQVDAEFAKDTTLHKLNDFTQTLGEGKNAVKVNYVKDGMNQLNDYYIKTGDAQGMADMKALANKAKTTGLTYQDINNLAREHGTTLNGYNANGELASGLSKQNAENTRTGLKTTARKGLGTSEAQALDEKVSEAIKTKALIDKQVERVNAFNRNNMKVGDVPKKLGKVVKAVAHPIDTVSRLTGVSGERISYSPAELEGRIPSNLKTIRGEGITPNVPQAGLSLRDVSKIHPDDQRIMMNYIDSIRLNKSTSPQLVKDAENLRNYFGIPDVSASKLADHFDNLLANLKNSKKE